MACLLLHQRPHHPNCLSGSNRIGVSSGPNRIGGPNRTGGPNCTGGPNRTGGSSLRGLSLGQQPQLMIRHTLPLRPGHLYIY